MTEAIQAKWKVHPDAQAMEEEWSGITDPNLRRKLQNRLNQRAASMCALIMSWFED